MSDNLDIFRRYISHSLKAQPSVTYKLESAVPDLPSITLFSFANLPEEGMGTFVTYGLSDVSHPKWHFGRPELILSVDSSDEAWGHALAGVVNVFRGEKAFSYGSVYMLDKPIVEGSGMSGFVIYMPSFIHESERTFHLTEKTVYLAQAYPIYEGEAAMIQKKGFEKFWSHRAFQDPYDVGRADVSLA